MARCSERDLKRLFALSGGRCAFPACKKEIVCRETEDVFAQIAHIIAKHDGGPRSDPAMSEEARNSYDNLLLLCPDHHAEIDGRVGPSKWTRDTLRGMKRDHELWVAERLRFGEHRPFNVSQLSYLNVPRLGAFAFLNGHDLDISIGDGLPLLIDGALLGIQLIHHFGAVLKSIDLNGLAITPGISIDASLVGVTAVFDGSFRTRNLPTIEKARRGTVWMKGILEKDPHVYQKLDQGRFVLPIDPKWILTTTGWSDYRASGRHTRLAGACTIKAVDSGSGTIVGTPLFIGTPRSPYDEWGRSNA